MLAVIIYYNNSEVFHASKSARDLRDNFSVGWSSTVSFKDEVNLKILLRTEQIEPGTLRGTMEDLFPVIGKKRDWFYAVFLTGLVIFQKIMEHKCPPPSSSQIQYF